ncbi:MAG TPA: PQQ-binding-like beta-propeller repeat protein [Candidatus Ozemobacteraceae bacterium]|nr:PQQ-binding-like beta-propeller repeat protein [Candidatus Ozemobacteraceae bacterium]
MSRRLLGLLLFLAGLATFIALQHPIESPSLLDTHIGAPVRFAPIVGNDRAYVVTDQALICLASSGQPLFRTDLPESICGPVFVATDQLAILTRSELRLIHAERGETLWQIPHDFTANVRLAAQNGRLLLHDDRRAMVFTRESRPAGRWEAVGSLTQALLPRDDVLVTLTSTLNASGTAVGRLSAYRLSTKSDIWSYSEDLTLDEFRYDNGQVYACTAAGQPVLIDVETGNELYCVKRDGYRLLVQTPSCLILLVAGGSRIEIQPLSSGGAAWSVNSSSPIQCGFVLRDDLVILNQDAARIFGIHDGNLKRQQQPGSALVSGGSLGAERLWLSYDDSLWWKTRYCSAYVPKHPKPLWTAGETKEGVWPPVMLSSGDLLVSRSGRIRLFAHSGS